MIQGIDLTDHEWAILMVGIAAGALKLHAEGEKQTALEVATLGLKLRPFAIKASDDALGRARTKDSPT